MPLVKFIVATLTLFPELIVAEIIQGKPHRYPPLLLSEDFRVGLKFVIGFLTHQVANSNAEVQGVSILFGTKASPTYL